MVNLPLFPTTVVGSWPRPPWLLEALRKRQAGLLSFREFQEVADRAVLDALRYQEEAGIDIVSDGEQRRDNFYSFVVEKLDGVRLMTLAEMLDYAEDKTYLDQLLRQLDAPSYAIKNPTAVGRLRLKMPLALDEAQFLMRHTRKPVKIPLPGPYLLTRSMWVKGISDSVYPTQEDLARDVVAILREEIVRLRDAGVFFIQLDEPILTEVAFRPPAQVRTFMCASLAAAAQSPVQELAWAARLINQVVGGIEGVKVGVHVCRGNWSTNEGVLLQGDYGPLLPFLSAMRVQQWVLEMATPRAGEMAVFAPYAGMREMGLGVVNPRTREVETPQEIVAKVWEALDYFEAGQIYLNPDCGFGTFAERPVNTPETASRKLRAMVEAAGVLRRRLGDRAVKAQAAPPQAPSPSAIPPAEAARLVREEKALLVDVREPWEWEMVRIPGAALIPLGELLTRLAEVPKDRPVVVYCSVGQRSAEAVGWLRERGYPRAVNLAGGITAWIGANLPTEP
jgi:5-methyltetrahydropteroyltriglutamate--homocysteine methyltransferase